MKNTIKMNNYSELISDANLSELLDINDIFNQLDGMEVSVTLWHMAISKTGYGHWRVSVELELNYQKLAVSHTTTDSMSIDNYNSDEDEIDGDGDNRKIQGFSSLLSGCINANEEKIIDFVCCEDVED